MNSISLQTADFAVIGAYLLLLLWLGLRGRSGSGEENFLLGNRSLTLPAFVATLVTTWYGGILGIGEFAWSYGISTWVVFGLPYYVFAVLFALSMAKRVRKREAYTIADVFYSSYGKPVGLLTSIFLLFMTSPAPYVLMLAVLLQALFGWSLLPALVVGTLSSTVYVFSGGFRSVVRTDKLQFVLIFAGFAVFAAALWSAYGNPVDNFIRLPETHRSWNGGNSFQYILVWFFLASWTFIDPGFHQRCYAAASGKIARNGILVSVLFWFLFDLLTVGTALYAPVVLKDINPVLAFPLLAETVLPPLAKGLFFTGMLAVIMSTIDSFSLLSAITIGRDILWRFQRKPNSIQNYTRIGLLITALVAILLAYIFPSVVRLWYVLGSLFIPPLLLPLLAAYYPRWKLPALATQITMLLSFLLSFTSFLYGQLNSADGYAVYLFGVEPFFPGLLYSVTVFLLYHIYRRLR
jgi:SSS family solute:Na+ symporter